MTQPRFIQSRDILDTKLELLLEPSWLVTVLGQTEGPAESNEKFRDYFGRKGKESPHSVHANGLIDW